MNRLAGETSPYLQQHRDNPVDWYPWGDEAFAAARERDVPVLLSVGYSACHWCHVMAHECFEDAEVAAAMNATFVNVKVDREERPDIDALYMDAVQAMTGRGGWPMTVVLDPQGQPFWGGTYFPKVQFLQAISAIDDAWRNKREDLAANSVNLLKAMAATSDIDPVADVPALELVNSTLQHMSKAFDQEWGGFGQAPKFPNTSHLELVLRAFMSGSNADARRVVTTTLDAMASGGMYDHVGGGFARYSTDREWLVPHFEKMLYDQAAMVSIYRQAFSACGVPAYRQVVEETIEYVLRDLQHPDGGFYSAEDADSPDENGHGVEGLFYTWTPAEVRATFDHTNVDTDAVLEWFDITDNGNFTDPHDPGASPRSIPNRRLHRGELQRPPMIEAARQRMLEVRSTRRRPGRDDKVLTEWNALFLLSLADAAAVFQRDDWKAAAVANGEFLLRELRQPNGRWNRSWHADGQPQARHHALAADHAALIVAFLRLGELTGEARWVHAASQTADTMLDWFWDPHQGGLYTTADDAPALVVRQKDVHDNATPSANSVAAHGLLRLSALLGEPRFRNHADRILQLLASVAKKAPAAVSNGMLAIELRQRGLVELAIVGDEPGLVKVAQVLWRPDLVLAWGEPFESPLWEQRDDGFAYLCRDHVCEQPVNTAEALYEKITGRSIPEGASLRL